MYTQHIIDLLIVDDDLEFGHLLLRYFSKPDIRGDYTHAGVLALQLADRKPYQVAILDINMPGLNGLRLLEEFRTLHPECEIILITGKDLDDSVDQARKQWDCDFLQKPVQLQELEIAVRKAYQKYQLRKENRQLRTLLGQSHQRDILIGDSEPMRKVARQLQQAAESEDPVLIWGEPGTGKELAAHVLHRAGSRANQPLMVVSCAQTSEGALESELFGHDKSPDGTTPAVPGMFELAHSGTLLIRDLGETSFRLQTKLAQVLEEGYVQRIGSLQQRRVHVRLIATSRTDLCAEVQASRFFSALLERLRGQAICLPPLRERVGDLPLLIKHFLDSDWCLEKLALQALEKYHWPGNVRQLIHTLNRAKLMADNRTICLNDLPCEISSHPYQRSDAGEAAGDRLSAIERAKVLEVLRRAAGNKTRAAKALGIDRRKLYRLLDKYEIRED